ncbi:MULTISPECIES: hypothetical protein [unclassified Imperialibacter]|uniref:hypothetical protein n=1 Tax=unclassified Imperialibacter TaxID=2629706 RepID=UPI001252340E|nr:MULTISPECIES: hypothetical protein [unclassified Imperialibacter]CAD5265331.1 conserved hypothetical protein [Imperialibacter sp. 89]CAD5270199.1 conserved hypothetical protein [Imperialibacter sp. 75]VVT09822.1 conserved hypothetical protein [Imperialibacter sp. EC-SDR9]
MQATSGNDHESENTGVNPVVVTLWIDAYSEIFSDFDPRPFVERAVSDDFVSQLKKVAKDSKGRISILRLLAPSTVRNEEDEKVIRKRLESYFSSQYQQLVEESQSVKAKGVYFVLAGLSLMVVASYISFLNLPHFYINLLRVLFEPAGWFLFWMGLEILFSFAKNRKNEINFFSRLAIVHIEFGSY